MGALYFNKRAILPPFLAGIYLLICIRLSSLYPENIISFPANLIGIIVILLGVYTLVWAIGLFKKKETPRNPAKTPKALVTNGPFNYTRNPMYFGLTLILLGISILITSAIVFLAPITFFITINLIYIPKEEKMLKNIFGQEYLDYKKNVRRGI